MRNTSIKDSNGDKFEIGDKVDFTVEIDGRLESFTGHIEEIKNGNLVIRDYYGDTHERYPDLVGKDEYLNVK